MRRGSHGGADLASGHLDSHSRQQLKSGFSMTIIVRQKGCRRFDMPVKFPMEDCQGVVVIQDRRRLPDRRKEKYGIDDLKVILSKMARN
jgi:hypothetical protein